ncbi:MAG TPA: tripartite tricarboxylate transporter substrate binding protein [Burkholderiaceae bacterium]|jgi:tripartite-type tricarboxylate transporter receptor subunit TctC
METTARSPRARRRLIVGAAAAGLACALGAAPLAAVADDAFPNHPIRMVVPFPPGGGFDAVARPFAEKLSAVLRQAVVVDNRAGAGGNIGTAEVGRAPRDGYTILFANEILATNPNMYVTAPFDPIKDFAPIAMIATTPLVLAIYPGLPAKNLNELIALSAKEPITFGTPGIGTSPHLFGELLNLKTPLKMRHIPYRGTGPAINDAMAGQTNAVLTSASSLTQQILGGKLRGIAILSDKRSPLVPELPTLAEAGIPGLTHDIWYAILAPAGTPPAIVAQLRDAAMTVMRDPELSALLRKLGFEPVVGDDKAVTALIQKDLKRWKDVIAEAKIPRE